MSVCASVPLLTLSPVSKPWTPGRLCCLSVTVTERVYQLLTLGLFNLIQLVVPGGSAGQTARRLIEARAVQTDAANRRECTPAEPGCHRERLHHSHPKACWDQRHSQISYSCSISPTRNGWSEESIGIEPPDCILWLIVICQADILYIWPVWINKEMNKPGYGHEWGKQMSSLLKNSSN